MSDRITQHRKKNQTINSDKPNYQNQNIHSSLAKKQLDHTAHLIGTNSYIFILNSMFFVFLGRRIVKKTVTLNTNSP